MLRALLLLLLLANVIVAKSSCETCEQEIAREQADDSREHGCRACKALPVAAAANCPLSGYDCDSTLKLSTNVLSIGSGCAQIKCADENALLAVGGLLTGKVRCAARQWNTTKGVIAVSGICARKCGLGVCQTLPDDYFIDNPTFEPFVVQRPDTAGHPCAWGSCTDGALGSTGTVSLPYSGNVEFSCGGDHTWRVKGSDAMKHKFMKCVKKQCDEMLYFEQPGVCETLYACYKPSVSIFVDANGVVETRSTCADENALRDSHDVETIFKPICTLGKWTSEGMDINDKVMCITCPKIETIPGGEQPEIDKTVTCPSKVLVIEYIHETDPPKKTNVTSLQCKTDEFQWETTGGHFISYSSLAEAVRDGITWKAGCQDGNPCVPLNKWNAAECTAYWESGDGRVCVDPITDASNTDVFACGNNLSPSVYIPDWDVLIPALEIKCNTAIGEWVYFMSAGWVMTQTELDSYSINDTPKFTCSEF